MAVAEFYAFWMFMLDVSTLSGNLTKVWRIIIFRGQIHYKWPFSIVILVIVHGMFKPTFTSPGTQHPVQTEVVGSFVIGSSVAKLACGLAYWRE